MQILEYIVLFAFLVFASCGWGALGCERTKLPVSFLFMLGFAFLALLAYFGFFAYLIDAILGRAVSVLIGAISVGLTVRRLIDPVTRRLFSQPDVWLPVLLYFLYTTSCFLVMLFHNAEPDTTLTYSMPPDNILPQIIADRLWHGGPTMTVLGMSVVRMDHLGPHFTDWLSSDRPPLQIGLYLLCRPFEFLHFNADELYVIVSTLFQTTWLPAVYLLARQLHFSRYAVGFTLVWCAASGFFLLHSIYTWPKLLSASLFLAGLAVLYFCANKDAGKHPQALLMLGLLWSLALLSHGGILFSFLALPFLPTAWRVARANLPAVLGAVGILVLINVPWSLYQKYYDPPGNRLIKWHLAGVMDVDPRGTFETLRDSYGSLTFHQWLINRCDNLGASLVWDSPARWHIFDSVLGLQTYLSLQCFFRVSAVVGVLALGYLVLVAQRWQGKRRGPPAQTHWGELLLMNIACYVIWILLMFRPDSAIVHQGSLAMVALFMMIGARGLAELPVWAGLVLLVAQWGFFTFVFLYTFYVPVTVDAAWYLVQALYWVCMGLFIFCVWAFLPRTVAD